MKKEKKVRAYTRKVNGKTVSVKAHTQKYDAAEEARKAFAKKEGAGKELVSRKSQELFGIDFGKLSDEEFKDFVSGGMFAFDDEGNELQAPSTRKGFISFMKKHYGDDREAQSNFRDSFKEWKKEGGWHLLSSKSEKSPKSAKVVKPEKKSGNLGFTESDYKAWYHWDMVDDPKNPQALKVKKALIARMGRSAYKKYEDEMSDSYTARGHLKGLKALGESDFSKSPERQKGIKKAADYVAKEERRANEEYTAMRLKKSEKKKSSESKASKVRMTDEDLKYIRMQATYAMNRIRSGRGRADDKEVVSAWEKINHPGKKTWGELTDEQRSILNPRAFKKPSSKRASKDEGAYREVDLTGTHRAGLKKEKFYVKDGKVFQKTSEGYKRVTKSAIGTDTYDAVIRRDEAKDAHFGGFGDVTDMVKKQGKLTRTSIAFGPSSESKKPVSKEMSAKVSRGSTFDARDNDGSKMTCRFHKDADGTYALQVQYTRSDGSKYWSRSKPVMGTVSEKSALGKAMAARGLTLNKKGQFVPTGKSSVPAKTNSEKPSLYSDLRDLRKLRKEIKDSGISDKDKKRLIRSIDNAVMLGKDKMNIGMTTRSFLSPTTVRNRFQKVLDAGKSKSEKKGAIAKQYKGK